MEYQLKTRQICLFFIAFLPLGKFFMMPSVIAGITGEDCWISVLINILIDFAVFSVLLYVAKKSDANIYTLLSRSLGKTLSKIVLILYVIYFLLKSVLSIYEQKEYVESTIYLNAQNVFYFLPFFIAAFFLCVKKLRILGRAADVFFLITLIGYVLLIALSINNLDLASVLPIGANGFTNIIKGSYKSINWFGDAVYFAFFIGEFKFGKKDRIKLSLSYVISCIMTLLFILVFYSVFTYISFRQRYALTETSKYTTVINNLERFDYFGISCILLSNVIGAALPVFFCSKILCKLIDIKRKWITILVLIGIETILITVFSEYYKSIEDFILNYAGYYYIFMSVILPCCAPLLIIKKDKNAVEIKPKKEKKNAVYQS